MNIIALLANMPKQVKRKYNYHGQRILGQGLKKVLKSGSWNLNMANVL